MKYTDWMLLDSQKMWLIDSVSLPPLDMLSGVYSILGIGGSLVLYMQVVSLSFSSSSSVIWHSCCKTKHPEGMPFKSKLCPTCHQTASQLTETAPLKGLTHCMACIAAATTAGMLVLICKCHKLLITLTSLMPTTGLTQLKCSKGLTLTQVSDSMPLMLHACIMLGRCFTPAIKVRRVEGVWVSGPLILAIIMGLAMTVEPRQSNFQHAVLTMLCMSQAMLLLVSSARQTTDLLTATQIPMWVPPVLVLAPNPTPKIVCSTTSSCKSQLSCLLPAATPRLVPS